MKEETKQIIEERLEKHSKQYGMPSEDLRELMEGFLPRIEANHPKMSDDNKYKLALRRLWAYLEKEQGYVGSEAETFTGFFIGDSGLENTADAMKRKILRMDKADQRIYHPDDNTWLDYRQSNYLKPIEGKDHRTYYGFFCPGRELSKDIKFTKLEAWRDTVTNISPKLDEIVTFRATVNNDQQKNEYHLNVTNITRLNPVESKASRADLAELIKMSGKDIYHLDELEMLYMTHFKDVFNADPVMVEADVVSIVYRNDKQNMVMLADELLEGYSATAYVPHHILINFSEADRVYFLGEIGMDNKRNKPTIFVKGFFRLPIETSIEFI